MRNWPLSIIMLVVSLLLAGCRGTLEIGIETGSPVKSARFKPVSRTFAGLLFVAAFMLTGCGQLQQPRPAGTAWDSPLPHSAKGYELYSWPVKQGNAWQFTLITGTNRLKTYDEIVSAEDIVSEGGWVKVSVTGTEDLKAVLSQLQSGESVTWSSGDWLKQVGVPSGSIQLPDEDVINEIESYCRQFGAELSIER